MAWSLDDLGDFALDLAKDITGITNFQNASDAFRRANATANAADGDVGKAISSLPSYVKDIGVGVGQAALGAGTALVNLIPATKARKAADVVTKAVTGGTKTAATKAEVLSTTASKNVTSTAKSADDARAAAKAAGEEAAAAKKAAEAAAKKAAEAKTADAAKRANEG
jgi:colicin import membrane protein